MTVHSGCQIALPVAAEIDARLVTHRERDDAVNLRAVGFALVILAPRGLLREPEQVRPGDVMVVSNLAAPHPAKETLGVVRMRLRFVHEAVGRAMVDPVQREPGSVRIAEPQAAENVGMVAFAP